MSHRRIRGSRVLVAVVVAAALALTGCTSPAQPDRQESDLTSFYNQTLHWSKCGIARCATVSVPLDWAHPSRGKLSLALLKQPATDGHPLGGIVYDPGGPGASGVDFVRDYGQYVTDKKLASAYDIIGFDSRGVGHSTAVKCLDQAALSHYYFDVIPAKVGTPAWVKAQLASQAAFVKGCVKNTGALLAYMDTLSAARDLDVVRVALGEKKLDYFGVSYGTRLGLVYAGLFPKNVGRFVLDGIDDPGLTGDELLVQQSAGFEDALLRYLAACVKELVCPFKGSVADAQHQLTALLARFDAHPVTAADGRTLNAYNLANAIINALYSPSSWGYLTSAIIDAKAGDASAAFGIIDSGVERHADGTYPNLLEVYAANLCDDFTVPHTPDAMATQAAMINAVAPTIGPYLGYQGSVCTTWPYQPSGTPTHVTATGSGPILLVSSTHDPATPLRWAQDVAKTLDNGHLITRDGDGHGSYNTGNACIDAAVDAYFLQGTVPAADPTC